MKQAIRELREVVMEFSKKTTAISDPKEDVIQLWRLMNLRICAVLENIPEANYSRQCDTGSMRTLSWLAEDYVKHLKHHLNQIISGSFDIVYK